MKILLLPLLFLPCLSFATGQTGERFIYRSGEVEKFGFPLEVFFKENPPRPAWLTEMNTACYRGYVGIWELIGEELYLNSVSRTKWTDSDPAPVTREILGKLFPKATPPLKANWFSGTLTVPRGKVLRVEGYTEIHEKEERLTFEKGKLTGSRTIDNRPKPRPHWKGKTP